MNEIVGRDKVKEDIVCLLLHRSPTVGNPIEIVTIVGRGGGGYRKE